jgi:hypothetical protein
MKNFDQQSGNSTCTRLYLNVRREKDGPVLLRKDLEDADQWDHRAEAWHAMLLRRGRPNVALDEVIFDLRPIYMTGTSGRLLGFSLETTAMNGARLRYTFDLNAVEHIATNASRELIRAGVLQPGDEYYYDLFAEQSEGSLTEVHREIVVKTSTAKLQYLSIPIQRLWKRATKVGPDDEKMAPVFFTEPAFSQAELFARRGGNQQPPVETGSMLVGVLCSCPESGEFFIVVCDAWEARDAESQEFSLTFTDRTWTRMQAILRARASLAEWRAIRFLGQAHGHPFLPANGAPPCELCAGKPDVVCARTSCFVSAADSDWSRAIFGRQPWQLCHIFGLNARGEHVNKLFGLRNGQFVERGFAVIPDFEPLEFDNASPASQTNPITTST